VSSKDRNLSPAEAARRLGVTRKALRLYEQHGLVSPVRSATGWRTYGPAEIARLHQVVALKRLGLPLARIAELLSAKNGMLAKVLALQEDVLARENVRVAHALKLIRAARAKLAAGEELSIDDLTTLTKETTMSSKTNDDEMKAIFDPLIDKHMGAEERAAHQARPFDQAEVAREWDALIAEAKTLMAKGDPASPEAQALARRWKAQVEKFTMGNPQTNAKVGAIWKDAMADPKAAPKLPLNPEIFAFMGKAMAAAK
jgi:MerR family transcriptional regulator, thiopeptide resistance regulator